MESRHIVITGVTRGIGRALVDRFAEAGHRVSGCGRSARRIGEVAQIHPAPMDFASLDVSDEEDVVRWAKNRIAAQGAPDLLINNAAVINPNAPFWEIAANDFDELMAINVSGTANVLRAFLPAMIKRGSGMIVNMSSGWGRSTSPEVAPYCASKWAIEGLTQALSQELPPGLGAVAVSPGMVDTEMLQSCFGEESAKQRNPEQWSLSAAPYLLGLDMSANGKSLSTP